MIYHATIPAVLPELQPTTNQVMDSLIGEAMRSGDMDLFEYALSRMRFDF
jgi:hypothetical protein